MKINSLNNLAIIAIITALSIAVISLLLNNQQLTKQNQIINTQLTQVLKTLEKVDENATNTARRIESIEQQLKPNLHQLLAKN
ncbi:hypothetical protein [Thalassotalea profundi]|uniref:DUF2570 domain-containing protein n=1 Tax=Thalassotalea profundi TaxID=2036687 RepID=A0ABQ3IJS4_9GAMM|nr:hypothetical protein [Thalassotalea profundi]GHE80936.1 hypothetical protein GCM10011501_06220 [Thalassotalea profundi]